MTEIRVFQDTITVSLFCLQPGEGLYFAVSIITEPNTFKLSPQGYVYDCLWYKDFIDSQFEAIV